MRSLLRRLRRELSVLLHRFRLLLGADLPPRVVMSTAAQKSDSITYPAIAVIPEDESAVPAINDFLQNQTEGAVVHDGASDVSTDFVFFSDGRHDGLPATHLESLLLSACAHDAEWTVAGWSSPAPGRFGPTGSIFRVPKSSELSHYLMRTPRGTATLERSLRGRVVPHICSPEDIDGLTEIRQPFMLASGPYRLEKSLRTPTVVRSRAEDLDVALASIPSVPGPRTVLFLLPFLAVGGAERLLFDLLHGLKQSSRLLVVCTDPHVESLGQTVDMCREITPYVYTLGDWMSREALPGALIHLLRRWAVQSLMCWNGNVLFFDLAPRLRERFPNLRIINQLFNHEGGWIDHYSPSLVKTVDCHVAVNSSIAAALSRDHRIPSDRIVTIHHGVRVPAKRSTHEVASNRKRLRKELGLPDDAIVVGSFIRMHPQKRPLDIIEVADRMRNDPVHFLLVGGGPLDAKIDCELEKKKRGLNLLRLPMRPDARELYDAVDVCLLTSEFEGLPVFLMDGLAREIPCVAPAVGDIPHLLENGGGILVEDPGDIEAIAAALRCLFDPKRRDEEGRRGCEKLKAEFGVEIFSAKYEASIFEDDSECV